MAQYFLNLIHEPKWGTGANTILVWTDSKSRKKNNRPTNVDMVLSYSQLQSLSWQDHIYRENLICFLFIISF